jgi:hypothetical protein
MISSGLALEDVDVVIPRGAHAGMPPRLNLTQYSYRRRSRASRDDYVSTYETKHP